MTHENGSGYVLFVWSPGGYILREMDGETPEIGHELEDDGHTLVVNKIGASPLPGDTRPCAYTLGKA